MIGFGIEQYGDEQQIKEIHVNTGKLGRNDLLISIKASGVNPVDWKVRKGLLQNDFPYQLPQILGWDAAGTVKEVGEAVANFQAGDDVFFRPEMEKQGTYADEIIVPSSLVAPMPKNLTHIEAASLPLVGLTVWQALIEVGNVKEKDHVLILAGSGGIGSFAIQLAKARGAYVAATTSKKNENFVKYLGADEVLLYDSTFFDTITSFDFMLDTLGGEAYRDAIRWMRRGGKVATIISERDTIRPANVDEYEKEKLLKVEFVFTRPDGENMNHIKVLVEAGHIRPIIESVFPMTVEGVRKAHLTSQTGRTRGKIVLNRRDG